MCIVMFYVFDEDKTGFMSTDDLNQLINSVHNIKNGEKVKGNVKESWGLITFKGS